jgi:chemosensory pili system protein ChpA (sensor histidine kinase/response regulator)
MKKILVVEDDVFIRDITSIKLTEHGYIVTSVENGVQALEAMKMEIPDVLLLDLDLPDITGLQILTKMQESLVLKKVPVIVFSNSDDQEMQESVAKKGIAGFFVKASTDYSELFSRIDAL